MTDNTLTEAELNLLYYMGYRKHTYPGGGFTTALYNAFAHADHWNTMKLASVFPEVAVAIGSYNRGDLKERYHEHVRQLMEKENPSSSPTQTLPQGERDKTEVNHAS